MQYGFHFNGRRCTGCKTCVLACKDFHDLPSDIAFRQVYEYGGGTWRRADDGTLIQDTFAYHLSAACNHCGNAACVRVCPTGAMHKDERGLVRVDADRCIGCGYCALSCPYRAPKVDRVAVARRNATAVPSVWPRAGSPSAWRPAPCARSISGR